MPCCFATIRSDERGVVTFLGEFKRVLDPGLSLLLFPFEVVRGRVSTRVHQLKVNTPTKTKDNVGVTITTAVQYRANPSNIYDAYYKLSNVSMQITAHIDDAVRSAIPLLTLDEAYEVKESVAQEVEQALRKWMAQYGYEICAVLLTDLQPAQQVMDAMNEINTARRLRDVASHRAEAEKVMRVARAEADAEVQFLRGTGLARKRQVMLDSMADAVESWKSIPNSNEAQVMSMIMVTQQIDLMGELGKQSDSHLVLGPQSPSPTVPQLQMT